MALVEKKLMVETPRGLSEGFPGWTEYPTNLRGALFHDFTSYCKRLADLGTTLCSQNEEETDISIIDIARDISDTRALSYERFRNGWDFENFLLNRPNPESRIISLCTVNSLEPLNITLESMRKMLTHYEIGTDFLDILFAFGTKPRESEAGLSTVSIKKRPDGTYDVCYLFVYVEASSYGKSWTTRQIGVFHRFSPETKSNLWVFLNPMQNSRVQQRLMDVIVQHEWLKDTTNPGFIELHLLAISSFINNWRWYLNDLSEEFEDTADVALTLDFSRRSDYSAGLKTLSKLQHLQDKILPLTARFEASLATISKLRELIDIFHNLSCCDVSKHTEVSNELASYDRVFRGHLVTNDLLKSRAQGILNLLTVTLDLKNQITSVEINNNMLSLTRDTVDDSATVRVVTLVTLIYLPASFVASILGMNLFSFQTFDGSGFQISQQFWIYIALSVPLTIITVGSWFIFARKRKKTKDLESALQRQVGF